MVYIKFIECFLISIIMSAQDVRAVCGGRDFVHVFFQWCYTLILSCYIGSTMKQVHSNLYRILLPTALAEALCVIPSSQIEAYCQYYIHDFLQVVHYVTHMEKELEIEVHIFML